LDLQNQQQLLDVEELTASYSEIVAFREVSLFVQHGEMVALIGANGAGKTSLLRTITGVLRPKKGKIEFYGREIHQLPAHQIVQLGISWVQEGRAIFKRVTIEENLRVGAYHRNKKEMLLDMEKIFEKFPILKDRRSQLAGTLSGGEQQMLAIARALMSRPKLVLLDEPSLGLAPIIVQDIYEIIKNLQVAGNTILLVEQNANIALKTAQRAYVMENGRIVMEGKTRDLMIDSRVQKAYLGGKRK
jgi:branched-chain amino acid transport system ATP-binding protein